MLTEHDSEQPHVVFVPADSDLDPALLSLGLTYTISLAATFQFCIAQSAEVENIVSQLHSTSIVT